eukprot:5915776-Pleurochrysis_carterae.AAC.2
MIVELPSSSCKPKRIVVDLTPAQALGLASSLALPDAVSHANRALGLPPHGSLSAQARGIARWRACAHTRAGMARAAARTRECANTNATEKHVRARALSTMRHHARASRRQ